MENLPSDETTAVATYSNRLDAEVARSFLEGRGIASFVAADEVHPPIQLTEGVRLLVLRGEAREAREALEDAAMLPRGEAGEEGLRPGRDAYEGWGFTISRPSSLTRWFYTTALVLILAAMVILVLFGTMA